MFSHHDLAILIVAMYATLCQAMDLEYPSSFPLHQSSLAYQMKNLAISEEPMEVDDNKEMEIDSLADEMDVDFYKLFNFLQIKG